MKKEEALGRREEEVNAALHSISEESGALNQIAASINKDVVEHTNRLKNSLSIHELAGMSGDFSTPRACPCTWCRCRGPARTSSTKRS
jgi:hypothetical protein